MRPWRLYLWPSIAFAIGVLLWPVSVFYTNSTLHMLAHASWAEVAMLAGAIQLALVRGKLTSRWWTLSLCVTLLVGGAASLIHEQNPSFSRERPSSTTRSAGRSSLPRSSRSARRCSHGGSPGRPGSR